MGGEAAAYALAYLCARLWCRIKGHRMVHRDPANGRRPTILMILCERCGGEVSLRVIDRSVEHLAPVTVM